MKVKWIIVILIIVLFLVNYLTESIPLVLKSNHDDSDIDFTVLCYNVKQSDVDYGRNQIYIAEEILAEKPDVVFLCEFSLSRSMSLDSLMLSKGEYKRYYRSKSNCIFYCRYNIDSIAAIETGNLKDRYARNYMIHLFLPNDTLSIIGCHLSSSRKDFFGGFRCRKQESDSINKCIIKEPHPIIVMGDMNDFSGSYTINRLKDAELKDAWWEGGFGYGTTFHSGWLNLRIDHILYQYDKLELVNVRVIDSDYSDHNALIANFRIKH